MVSPAPFIACAVYALSTTGCVGVTPVQQVVNMLEDMAATARKELQDEQVQFGTFGTWCTERKSTLKADIGQGSRDVEMLGTKIGKLEDETKNLGLNMATLDTDVASHQQDVKAEQAQRAKDHKEFLQESQEYAESVDALERAILVLEKQSYDRKATSAVLLQLEGRLPEQARSVVTAFTQMVRKAEPGESMDYAAPEANAYEFQSGGLVDMLKKLAADFKKKLGNCQIEEKNSMHAANMVVQDLTDSIAHKSSDRGEKSAIRQAKLGEKAKKNKQLMATQSAKQEDEATLSDVTVECEEKGLSFKEKQKLRQEEIQALDEATRILQSKDVAGNAEKHLELAQTPLTSMFAQLRSASQSENIRRDVREFLSLEGRRLHSKSLEFLSQKIASDPFAKVKKLIDDLITRLLEESHADADHEGYCDKEFGQSKITRNRLNDEIDQLDAAVEGNRANIMDLTSSIKNLDKEVAELVAAMGEATEMRNAEHKTNKATVADAVAAQKAVQAATAVLKTYYAKAAQATALIQINSPVKFNSPAWQQLANPDFETSDKGLIDGGVTNTELSASGSTPRVDTGHRSGMQTFGGSTFTGQQDEAGGVLAMLEIIMSDFLSLETDTNSQESAAARAHKNFMTEATKNKATKMRNVALNKQDVVAANAKLTRDVADLKSTQDELLAADRYYEKLVPQCIDKGMTYDEKTAARAAEIKSLKEALDILNREDVATLS